MARGGARQGAGRKAVEDKKKPVAVTLTDLERDLLDDIAKKNGITRSAAVAYMIHETYLKNFDDGF
jgi:hypothetical protein